MVGRPRITFFYFSMEDKSILQTMKMMNKKDEDECNDEKDKGKDG